MLLNLSSRIVKLKKERMDKARLSKNLVREVIAISYHNPLFRRLVVKTGNLKDISDAMLCCYSSIVILPV